MKSTRRKPETRPTRSKTLTLPVPFTQPLYNAANCDDNEGGGGYKLEKKGKERGGEEIGGPRKRGRFSGLEEFLEDRRFKRSEDFESAK